MRLSLSLIVLCLLGFALTASGHAAIEIRIAELTQRIAADPDDAVLYVRRGEQYRDHQRWDDAIADFRTAARLSPTLAADALIGRTLFEAGRLTAARQHLEGYLALHPSDGRARSTLARTLAALGEPRAAAAAFTLAIADTVPPAHPAIDDYLDRAANLMRSDVANLDDAIQGLDAGYRQLGAIVLQLEAMRLERKHGRFDEALHRVEQIAALADRKESWTMERGAILEQAGRPCAASAAYTQALHELAEVPRQRRSVRTLQLEEQARAAIARLSQSPITSRDGGTK